MSESDIRIACSFLTNYFTGCEPTLKEVCDVVVGYCNSENHTFNNYVYLLTFPSGKRYAGQTVDLKQRMATYKSNRGANPHMTNALKKHDWTSIIKEHFSIPTVCADIIEIFLISWYDLVNRENGYNKTTGGKSGYIITEEARERMSKAHTGVPLSAEHRASLCAVWTDEHRAMMSAASIAAWTVERRAEKSARHLGVPLSAEHRAKLSALRKGVPLNAEWCANISAAKKGSKHPNWGVQMSDDQRAKISISLKGVPKSDEHCAKLSERQIGNKNHNAKPVVVEGRVYAYAREAVKEAFPTKCIRYVDHSIRKHPESDRMFYISKEFYTYCEENEIKDVTRTMYNGFEHYMNNLL